MYLTPLSAGNAFLSPHTGTTSDPLREACAQFEALLVTQLLSVMRASLPNDGLIPRSDAEQTFQQYLDAEYSLQMSRSNPVGLATMLYQQLSRQTAPPENP